MSDYDNDETISYSQIAEKQKTYDYKAFYCEMPWQVGLGKIYDPVLLYEQKQEDYFKKEFELKFTGIGQRVFSDSIILQSVDSGSSYLNQTISPYSEKYIGLDPAFAESNFGVVVNELHDGNIRVLYSEEFERKNTQVMIDKILELRARFRNVKNIFVDASQSEFIVDIKSYFDNTGYEYPESYMEKIREWWHLYKKQPWEMGMYIIPVSFGSGNRIKYIQRLHKAMSNNNYWINESFDKLLTSFETAVCKEQSDIFDVDKQHQEFNDVFDAQIALFYYFKPL